MSKLYLGPISPHDTSTLQLKTDFTTYGFQNENIQETMLRILEHFR